MGNLRSCRAISLRDSTSRSWTGVFSMLLFVSLIHTIVLGVTSKLERKFDTMALASGVELGLYLVLGNALQVIGLKTVSSDRAGFLVQLTTVMVPLVEASLARDLGSIPPRTWFSCFIVLGVVVMGAETTVGFTGVAFPGITLTSFSDIVQSMSNGDLLIVGSAFMYTLHVVRLGRYARDTTPLKLAASKATVEAALSVALIASLIGIGDHSHGDGLVGFAQEAGFEISSFLSSFPQGIASGSIPQPALYSALGAVAWTGWITCAYTIYAQSFGQQRVSPTDANLIYSAQPLFTALFAWLLLGETMGPYGVLGGVMIGLAVYWTASTQLNKYCVPESERCVRLSFTTCVIAKQESIRVRSYPYTSVSPAVS